TNDNDPCTIDLRAFNPKSRFWDRAMVKLFPQNAGFNIVSSAIASAIRSLVEEHKFHVIEMEESFGFSFAISRLKLLPVVVRLHGPWFLNGRFNDPHEAIAVNRYRQKWEGRAIRAAQLVTAPSAVVLQSVKDHYGISLPASRVIPNPIDAAVEGETWNI